MRVAFDDQIFVRQRTGGISRYFVELIDALRPQPGIEPLAPSSAVVTALAAERWGLRFVAGRLSRKALVLRRRMTAPALPPDADLVHHTFYDPAWLDDCGGIRRVVTVHDMLPERFPDLVATGVHMAKREYVAAADLILTNSEFTRQELIECYGQPAAPVIVTHLGVAPAFARPGLGRPDLPPDFVLFVGNRGGYKDFTVLLDAMSELPPDLALVAVGGGPWTTTERAALERAGANGRVFRMDLSDPDLAAAYRGARLSVVPSRYEGFGLPLLEAMAAGSPAVAAGAGALPEVGGDAARYFDAGDAQSLAAAITAVNGDHHMRESLVQAGRRRAAEFTWERTARATLTAYESLL